MRRFQVLHDAPPDRTVARHNRHDRGPYRAVPPECPGKHIPSLQQAEVELERQIAEQDRLYALLTSFRL